MRALKCHSNFFCSFVLQNMWSNEGVIFCLKLYFQLNSHFVINSYKFSCTLIFAFEASRIDVGFQMMDVFVHTLFFDHFIVLLELLFFLHSGSPRPASHQFLSLFQGGNLCHLNQLGQPSTVSNQSQKLPDRQTIEYW